LGARIYNVAFATCEAKAFIKGWFYDK